MLTQSERKWCKKRQKINNSPLQEPWVLAPEFMLMAFNEMHEAREAAEFEQRVAAKLARMSVDAMLPCFQTNGDCPYTIPNCAWCRLMVARLLVEEEMNGEKDNS